MRHARNGQRTSEAYERNPPHYGSTNLQRSINALLGHCGCAACYLRIAYTHKVP